MEETKTTTYQNKVIKDCLDKINLELKTMMGDKTRYTKGTSSKEAISALKQGNKTGE